MGGEGYMLTGIFGRVLGQHGLVVACLAIAFLAVIVVAVPVAIYFAKTKLDLVRQDQVAVQAERGRTEQRLDEERKALVAEVSAARHMVEDQQAKLYTFMTNHLEHDRQEREALGLVLTETREAMRAMSQDLRGHREEESGRAGQFHEELRDISTQIQVLAARVPGALPRSS
jgi:hypothetical protein